MELKWLRITNKLTLFSFSSIRLVDKMDAIDTIYIADETFIC